MVIAIHSVAYAGQVLTLAGTVVVSSHEIQAGMPAPRHDDKQRWTYEPWHDNLGHPLITFKNVANNQYLALAPDYQTIITTPGRFGWTLRSADGRNVLYDETYTHKVLELSGRSDGTKPNLGVFNRFPTQEWDFISA